MSDLLYDVIERLAEVDVGEEEVNIPLLVNAI